MAVLCFHMILWLSEKIPHKFKQELVLRDILESSNSRDDLKFLIFYLIFDLRLRDCSFKSEAFSKCFLFLNRFLTQDKEELWICCVILQNIILFP